MTTKAYAKKYYEENKDIIKTKGLLKKTKFDKYCVIFQEFQQELQRDIMEKEKAEKLVLALRIQLNAEKEKNKLLKMKKRSINPTSLVVQME